MEAHSDQWYVGWFRWSCRVLDRFVRLRRYDREHRYQHGTNLCHFFRTLFWGTTVAAASLAMWAWTAYVVVVMPLTMFPLAGLAHTIGLVLACIAGLAVLVFSVLLVLIGSATAYAVIVLKSRVIPIVLGIFGYTYGSLLGVFLVGMLTRTRGSNRGNLVAMACGFVFVAVLSGLHNDLWTLIHPAAAVGASVSPLWKPDWLPTVEFPWRIMFGTLLTFAVAVAFRTPQEQVEKARNHVHPDSP